MKNFRRSAFALILGASFSFASLSYAQDVIKMDCRMTDQVSEKNQPASAKDTFDTQAPKIFIFCTSDDLKKGQAVKAVWIADNTHGRAPDNTKIIEKTITLPEVPDNKMFFSFVMTKPTNGWPVGTYHVEIYVDDQKAPQQSLPFSVSENKTSK